MTSEPVIPGALMVIAKAPIPGRVKTRLCPPLDCAGACRVARACLLDTLDAAAAVPAQRHVLVFEGDPTDWCPPGWECIAQRGGFLGERLANAFQDVADAAVVIAMDTPQVSPASLRFALRALGGAGGAGRAAFGPAQDGGFWAIGLPRGVDPAAVFADVPMSTGETGARQRERLVELGLEVIELETLRDIDVIADLRAVAEAAPDRRVAAVARALLTPTRT